MNAAIEKMLTRHAIRRFRPEQISEAELRQVLEPGLYAPSAGNNQKSHRPSPRHFRRTAQHPGRFFHPERLLRRAHGDSTIPRDSKYRCEDAAMMGENMLLAAHFPGLGACYVGRAHSAGMINSAGESVPR